MVNALTRDVGISFGPIVLETLVKHYFERLKKDHSVGKGLTQLRKDELLYDQAFNVVKNFLAVASHHTVEECQSFSNTRTPSPPWVRVVRILIPTLSCDQAAIHLIKVLGGDENVKRTVGGTKWWQVRGLNGIDAQWIVAKKDWKEAKKKYKEQEKHKDTKKERKPEAVDLDQLELGTYQQDMDEMRCILYAHGGGYYFGSVDQERYSIQRHARKINGRVFAVNYRLAPQYPFPCAVQDMLAAYLFLIQPPTGAVHRPVKPAHIILAGDSAGGGITLALLQVLRDAKLPLPAGAILVSPWCDLTHSFPSIHTNTDTDVIPEYGLSMQKPSTLWPPPSYEMTIRVHATLRERIQDMVRVRRGEEPSRAKHRKSQSRNVSAASEKDPKAGPDAMPVDVGQTAAAPPLNSAEKQPITVTTQSGEKLTIEDQVHLYTQNSLIIHPLVSPALSYLGGLPPLLWIEGDGEVLRDEGIYSAHKAADPKKYTIRDEVRAMYPPLQGIEERYGPTPVHLQVYDDAAHVLPVLFSFTTPAKFCFRAIATFCKHVTGMVPEPKSQITSSGNVFLFPPMPYADTPPTDDSSHTNETGSSHFLFRTKSDIGVQGRNTDVSSSSMESSLRRQLSHAALPMHNGSSNGAIRKVPIGKESEDVASPRQAGDPIIYSDTKEFPSWHKGMIRERVSTQGIIRPLEPESDLDAFHIPANIIGEFSELAVRRYLDAKSQFDKKYHGTRKYIDKRRHHNLKIAGNDVQKNMAQLQGAVSRHPESVKKRGGKKGKGIAEGLEAVSGSWSWAWALESDERPPPSSIVSRRDTEEARQLAKIADQTSLDDSAFSGNRLWSTLVDFLATPPGKEKYQNSDPHDGNEVNNVTTDGGPSVSEGKKSQRED